jgi:hypothetical protein
MEIEFTEEFIILKFPLLSPENRYEKIEKILTKMGYHVDGGGTDLEEKMCDVWIKNTGKFYCLCCGVEISEEQFCYSHGLCGYCDTGACQIAPFIFKEGHGKII